MPDAAQNGVSGQGSDSALSAGIRGTVSKMDSGKLAELEAYLNEESSYGFLLSSYEQPQEIDLNQVFYAGAGFEQKTRSCRASYFSRSKRYRSISCSG